MLARHELFLLPQQSYIGCLLVLFIGAHYATHCAISSEDGMSNGSRRLGLAKPLDLHLILICKPETATSILSLDRHRICRQTCRIGSVAHF
jgi:hypothetical protein